METQIVGLHGMSGSAVARQSILRKVLLVCGIISSLLYVVATILGAMRWEGYSTFDQSVSELIAIDAPSAPIVVPLFFIYSLLIYAFGVGVWMSAGQKRVLRVAAVLIIFKEVLGLAGLLVARVHLRGVEPTQSDSMHIVVTAVGTLLCIFPALVLGAVAFGKWFRLYSIATMVVFLVFGFMGGRYVPQIAANLPTPWLGVWERICIFGYLLWVVVLAVTLIRIRSDSSKNRP